jgi:hypothetical protein
LLKRLLLADIITILVAAEQILQLAEQSTTLFARLLLLLRATWLATAIAAIISRTTRRKLLLAVWRALSKLLSGRRWSRLSRWELTWWPSPVELLWWLLRRSGHIRTTDKSRSCCCQSLL